MLSWTLHCTAPGGIWCLFLSFLVMLTWIIWLRHTSQLSLCNQEVLLWYFEMSPVHSPEQCLQKWQPWQRGSGREQKGTVGPGPWKSNKFLGLWADLEGWILWATKPPTLQNTTRAWEGLISLVAIIEARTEVFPKVSWLLSSQNSCIYLGKRRNSENITEIELSTS